MNQQEKRALLAMTIGNGIFGFSFMFSRVALQVASPAVMLMIRFLMASALLGAIAWRSNRRNVQGWMRFALQGKPIAPLVALGLVQPVFYFWCESYGISLTNVTFSGVMIALVPIAALIGGVIALHEIPRRKQVGWSLFSIAGVVLMTVQQDAQGAIHPLGVLMLTGAVLCGATFNILSRKLSTRYSALERTVVMMTVAAVAFTGMAIWECRGAWHLLVAPLHNRGFLVAMLYLSVLSSVLAFLMLNFAGTILPVARTTVFCNLTTAISVMAGVVFLGEPFGVISLVASVMIIWGVWQVQKV